MTSSMIVRLCLRRGLAVRLHAGFRYQIELILASEFYDAVAGLLSKCAIYCSVQEAESWACIGEERLLQAKWIKKDVGAYEIMAPEKEGSYHVVLRGVVQGASEVMVLSWISDAFEVCKEDTVLGFTPKMLTCLREFDVEEGNKFRFREEYGAGMGTHIYDSTVVLMRFLCMQREAAGKEKEKQKERMDGLALELGSGCGVLGVFLDTIYESVLVTDKGSQLPLLTRNVADNEGRCEVSALDWASPQDWLALTAKMESLPPLRAVYGADILYDAEAARHLVHLLVKLKALLPSESDRTVEVVIAQKMRGDEAVEVPQLFKSFSPEVACEESGVKVWRLAL